MLASASCQHLFTSAYRQGAQGLCRVPLLWSGALIEHGVIWQCHIISYLHTIKWYGSILKENTKLYNSHTMSCVLHRVVLFSSNILEQMIRTWTVYPTSLHADPFPFSLSRFSLTLTTSDLVVHLRRIPDR